MGSPPLARGIRRISRWGKRSTGITPACAGNTTSGQTVITAVWDHPRLRGEYSALDALNLFGVGSPPLARGILGNELTPLWKTGITPACAGNTKRLRDNLVSRRDHPRLRGEYSKVRVTNQSHSGSPPLARGIHARGDHREPHSGITPACAGNTYRRDCFLLYPRDHPRLRGEYTKKNPIFTAFSQSLPLNFI